ncbi:MAG TPA: hypothetical protein ENH85_11575 [Candidatus Scalindua sp.]|nr:hypothetical protein [Candidatus Scalindua sp.]
MFNSDEEQVLREVIEEHRIKSRLGSLCQHSYEIANSWEESSNSESTHYEKIHKATIICKKCGNVKEVYVEDKVKSN